MHCGNTHNTLHCNTIICYIVAAQQMRCTGAALDTRGTRNGGPKTMWHHKKQIQTTTTKKPSSLIAKKKKIKKYCSTAAAAGQKTRCTAAAQKPCCPVVAQKSKNKTNKKPCPAAAHKKHAALRQHKAKNPNMPPSGCTKNPHCTVAVLKKHAALRQQKLKNYTLHCGCTRKMRHCDSTKKKRCTRNRVTKNNIIAQTQKQTKKALHHGNKQNLLLCSSPHHTLLCGRTKIRSLRQHKTHDALWQRKNCCSVSPQF